MLSDEWLSRYGLLENFNASVTRTGTGTGTHTGTGTWTTGVTAIALCTSCSRAKNGLYFTDIVPISNLFSYISYTGMTQPAIDHVLRYYHYYLFYFFYLSFFFLFEE